MGESTDSHDRPLRADARRNRERILRAAAEVFAESGLDASLDEIAARAGVGVGTVYRRFPDKDGLIDELFEERIAEFVQVAEECAEIEDPWQAIVAFIERASEVHGRDLALRQLILSSGGDRELVSRPRQVLAPLVGRMLERAQESGQLRPDLEVLDIPLIEVLLAQAMDLTGSVAPHAWKRMLTVVIDGLRADPEGHTPMPVPGLTVEQYTDAVAAARKR